MLQTESKNMSQPETEIMLKSNLKPELDDFVQTIYELPPKAQKSMRDFLQGAIFMMNINREVNEGEDITFT